MEEIESSKRSSKATNKQYINETIEERKIRMQKIRSKYAFMWKRKIETETQEIRNLRRKGKDLQSHRG